MRTAFRILILLLTPLWIVFALIGYVVLFLWNLVLKDVWEASDKAANIIWDKNLKETK